MCKIIISDFAMKLMYMFSLYLDPIWLFCFIWLKLVLNEQAFKCIQSSLNTSIV